MSIEFQCPHCKTKLRAGSDLAGSKGTCPSCEKEITVPAQDTKGQNKEKKTVEDK